MISQLERENEESMNKISSEVGKPMAEYIGSKLIPHYDAVKTTASTLEGLGSLQKGDSGGLDKLRDVTGNCIESDLVAEGLPHLALIVKVANSGIDGVQALNVTEAQAESIIHNVILMQRLSRDLHRNLCNVSN
jgi:hypothetical protein